MYIDIGFIGCMNKLVATGRHTGQHTSISIDAGWL